MSETRERYYRILFWIAAVYDITLGLVFLFFSEPAFELLDAANRLPDQGAFVSLIAAFLFVIGIAYVLIARGDLLRNRDLIAIGALYKLAYTSVAVYYLVIGEYPDLAFVAVFGLADLVFFVLMTECWLYLGRLDPKENRATS
jgi:hypothetical protein